ncbi:hypothetical protein AGLY_017083 [Aphis glycines]|uniref:Uncharacterized protein n=1 Tax=Aphis glycines TaxID=307491 RepID=A0A6G0SWI5_APHGL|nr:hypothetical protein AGLY_017083 [Aphis glycines]
MGYSCVDQGLRLKSLIDDITISNIIEDKLYKIAISILIKISIKVTILYQTFGWSIKLIAGIFSSTTHYINQHYLISKQENTQKKQKQHQEEKCLSKKYIHKPPILFLTPINHQALVHNVTLPTCAFGDGHTSRATLCKLSKHHTYPLFPHWLHSIAVKSTIKQGSNLSHQNRNPISLRNINCRAHRIDQQLDNLRSTRRNASICHNEKRAHQ